eukprot:UC4_evm3s134
MSITGPCCPPGSIPRAKSDEIGAANVIMESKSGLKVYYVTGPSSTPSRRIAVLVLSDVYGFDGGRQRIFCDELAHRLSIPVYMPDLFDCSPPARWGDGSWLSYLPSSIAFAFNLPSMIYQLKYKFGTEKMQKIVSSTISMIQEKEGENVQLIVIGFCFGAWVAAEAMPVQYNIKAAVGFHPSFGVARLHGRNEIDLVKSIDQPILLLPASNDPGSIKPGGSIAKLLEKKKRSRGQFQDDLPVSFEVVGTKHGYMARGDSTDPKTKYAQEQAMELACKFLDFHISKM